jgi:Flp pilus assembly protein TadG
MVRVRCFICRMCDRLAATCEAALASCGRGLCETRGATAVEFALIALPLFTMIGAVLEMALVLVISASVESASAAMARQIRIGAVVAPGVSLSASGTTSLATFKADLCQDITWVPLATCMTQIQVDIRPLSSFGLSEPTSPISGGAFNTGVLCYASGTSGSVVLMRVYYLWPLLTPFLLNGLENVSSYSGGSQSAVAPPVTGRFAAVSSTEVFVNEPNPAAVANGATC